MRGLSSLTIDAIVGVVALVEALQYNVASIPGILGKAKPRRAATGIGKRVYRGTSVTGFVGDGIVPLESALSHHAKGGSR